MTPMRYWDSSLSTTAESPDTRSVRPACEAVASGRRLVVWEGASAMGLPIPMGCDQSSSFHPLIETRDIDWTLFRSGLFGTDRGCATAGGLVDIYLWLPIFENSINEIPVLKIGHAPVTDVALLIITQGDFGNVNDGHVAVIVICVPKLIIVPAKFQTPVGSID